MELRVPEGGDSVILRHPIGSCHCSGPPPRSAHQSSCCVSSPAWTFSCDENHHTHTHRYLFHAAVKRKRRCMCVCCSAWFLRSCLVLKGRSQLLILRCTEKAPCTEVRDRLRNRNYGVFYLQTFQRDFICRVFPVSGLCGMPESGRKCEYVACSACNSHSL